MSMSERTFTLRKVVALVEAMQATAYNQTKARGLTFVEGIVGRELTRAQTATFGYLLDDVSRAILAAAQDRVPEITPTMIEEARRERLLMEDARNIDRLLDKQRRLQRELEWVAAEVQHSLASWRSSGRWTSWPASCTAASRLAPAPAE
jgi:hypothetical protein